jgi:hypothetical protein
MELANPEDEVEEKKNSNEWELVRFINCVNIYFLW